MRFFKKPWFQRFASRESITDDALKSMVKDMEDSKINAGLGGYVYKQRLGKGGGGKSGGYRLLIFFAGKIASSACMPSPRRTEPTSHSANWSS